MPGVDKKYCNNRLTVDDRQVVEINLQIVDSFQLKLSLKRLTNFDEIKNLYLFFPIGFNNIFSRNLFEIF